MKQKNADLLLLIQAGLMGFAPLFAMLLLKTKKYDLYVQLQEFLFISKISLTDKYWVFALLISITSATGIAIYYQSHKRKRGALLCISSFAFLKSLVFLPLLVDGLFISTYQIEERKKIMVFLFAYYLLWFAASLITLVYFARKERKLLDASPALLDAPPETEDVLAMSDLNTETIVITSREKRFANYLADSFIIILIMAPVLGFFFKIGKSNIYGEVDRGSLLLQSAIAIVVYYGLFETCFKSTPGKYLTGTRVVNDEGKSATVLQTIGRSLCRLIPFEHFSFLGTRGWHDSITQTEVIEAPQIKM